MIYNIKHIIGKIICIICHLIRIELLTILLHTCDIEIVISSFIGNTKFIDHEIYSRLDSKQYDFLVKI